MGDQGDARVAVFGNDGVGKSSLIAVYYSHRFPKKVMNVITELQVRQRSSDQTVSIRDTDANNHQQVKDAISWANLAMLVYSCDEENSLLALEEKWIPLVENWCHDLDLPPLPIILVGAKYDVGDHSKAGKAVLERILPVIERHESVELHIFVSAKTDYNVQKAFHSARHIALYPLSPLFNGRKRKLKRRAIVALKRIFRLCDLDNDGYLNKDELKNYHKFCFDQSLSEKDVAAVHRLLVAGDCGSDYTSASLPLPPLVEEKGVTVEGFLFLQHLFLETNGSKDTWTTLRKFHYDRHLEYSPPSFLPKTGPGEVVELSKHGIRFLGNLFDRFSTQRPGTLTVTEEETLFMTSPRIPWSRHYALELNRKSLPDFPMPFSTDEKRVLVETHSGGLTKRGFLSRWSYQTAVDFRVTAKYLGYLGYSLYDQIVHCKHVEGLTIQRSRAAEHDARHTRRNTFRCLVVGSPGCGKTSMIRCMLGSGPFETEDLSRDLACVQCYGSIDNPKFLIAEEVVLKTYSDLVGLINVLKRGDVDALCTLYDVTDAASHRFACMVIKHVTSQRTLCPNIVIATKCDLPRLRYQKDSENPQKMSKRVSLPWSRMSILDRKLAGSTYDLVFKCCNEPWEYNTSHHSPLLWAAKSVMGIVSIANSVLGLISAAYLLYQFAGLVSWSSVTENVKRCFKPAFNFGWNQVPNKLEFRIS